MVRCNLTILYTMQLHSVWSFLIYITFDPHQIKLTMYKWHYKINIFLITTVSCPTTAQPEHASNYALAVNSKVSSPSRNPKAVRSTYVVLNINDISVTFRWNKTRSYKAALGTSQRSPQIPCSHPEVSDLSFPTRSVMLPSSPEPWSSLGHKWSYVPMCKLFYITFPLGHSSEFWVIENRLKRGNNQLIFTPETFSHDTDEFVLE